MNLEDQRFPMSIDYSRWVPIALPPCWPVRSTEIARPNSSQQYRNYPLVHCCTRGGYPTTEASKHRYRKDGGDGPLQIEAVSASDGYMAKATLAASRVRTDLADVASAITVVTPQLLKDTDSHKRPEFAGLHANTQIGGIRGNFSGFSGLVELR